MTKKKPKDQIVFFEDLKKPEYPDQPFISLSGKKDTLYFGALASEIIREHEFTHFRLGIDPARGAALLVFCPPRTPHSRKLSGGNPTKKGPGTYQAGGVRAFFEHYGIKPTTERRHFVVEFNEKLKAFEFTFKELGAELAKCG